MNTLFKRFLPRRSFGIVAFLRLSAFAGTGPLALGQDTVQGKLTLPVEARLGNTVLPPGEYRFHVTLAGTTSSVNSIQDVATPVIVTLNGLTKDGPIASVVAMAFKRDPRSPKAMDIQQDGAGKMIHAISLENLGLVLQIIDNKPAKTLHARGPDMALGVTSAKASD